MQEKLENLKVKYLRISQELASPDVISNRTKYSELSREFHALEPVVDAYDVLLRLQQAQTEYVSMLDVESDPEMRELIQAELANTDNAVETQIEEIKLLLLPKDEDDDKNVIVEIRAGTGGDEAALFGANLMRMYLRYAERHRLNATVISLSDTQIGGIKEAIILIKGKGVYSRLKFENGAHRVQRVPETESQGRIHTSAATVAVMCEADDIDIDISPSDLRIDTYRSSGAGGQHVNKTESAIRITHIPTGIVVQCQDEKSQIKNRETAMKVLKSRIYDYEKSKHDAKIAGERKSAVGSGDRSERIRTYNFPQDRITDHRVNLTLYKLSEFIDGDMDEILDALYIKARMDKLSSVD